MPSNKIPEPPLYASRRTLKMLRFLMQPTHPTPEAFRRLRNSAKGLLHDFDLISSERQEKTWGRFVKKMLSREPLLDMYQDCWPLEYFYAWEKDYIVHKERKQKRRIANKNSVVALRTITNQYLPKPSSVTQIDVQSASPIDVRSNSPAPSPRPKLPRGRPRITRPLPDPTQSIPKLEPNTKASPQPILSKSLPVRLPASGTLPTPPLTDSVIVNCINCPVSTAVPDRLYNSRLREVVQHSFTLLQALARVGVIFDHHFHLLQQQSDLMQTFFDSLSTEQMDSTTKDRLFRLFANTNCEQRRKENEPPRPTTSRVMTTLTDYWIPSNSTSLKRRREESDHEDDDDEGSDESDDQSETIPAPSPMDEEGMLGLDYRNFKEALRVMMRLDSKEDQELWDKLRTTMKQTLFKQFFSTNSSDANHLRRVINKVCMQHPSQFERYEDYWPIRILLNRFKPQAAPYLRSTYTRRQESTIFADVFAKNTRPNKFIASGARFSQSRSVYPRSADQQVIDLTQNANQSPFRPKMVSIFQTSSSSSSSLSTNPVKSAHQAIYPTINQVPCKHHPPVKVDPSSIPSSLQKHLHSQGMGELIPFLACPLYASRPKFQPTHQRQQDPIRKPVPFPMSLRLPGPDGGEMPVSASTTTQSSSTPNQNQNQNQSQKYLPAIQTDAHFFLFCQLTPDERLEILDDPALKGKFSAFQRFLFRRAF